MVNNINSELSDCKLWLGLTTLDTKLLYVYRRLVFTVGRVYQGGDSAKYESECTTLSEYPTTVSIPSGTSFVTGLHIEF